MLVGSFERSLPPHSSVRSDLSVGVCWSDSLSSGQRSTWERLTSMLAHFARLGFSKTIDLPVAAMERLAASDETGCHGLTEDPERADLIVFPQCHMLPTDWQLHAIRKHPLTRRFQEKVMVYDERDRPWCAFPGVYVSMPAAYFDGRYQ